MGKLTRAGYKRLIEEDIAWLLQQPRTLERDHIEAVLRDSSELGALIAERDELKEVLRELLPIALVEVVRAEHAAEGGHVSEAVARRAREVAERAKRLLGF